MQKVAVHGYQIVSRVIDDMAPNQSPRLVLTPIAGDERECEFRQYDPEKARGLFRKFAALDMTTKSIIRFANRYGLLGVPGVGSGELVNNWLNAIQEMRSVLQVWDILAQMPDGVRRVPTRLRERLEQLIHWVQDLGVSYSNEDGSDAELIASPPEALDIDSFDRFQPGTTIMPAKQFLKDRVNKYLEDKDLVSTRLEWDDSGTSLQFVIRASSLLGTMWLEVAREVGKVRMKPCEECGQNFPYQRESAKYCSPKCKMKAIRTRKRNGAGASEERGTE